MLLLVLAAAAGTLALDQSGQPEIRALWVTRAALGSAASIATMVDTARSAGFNTLFLQVRPRGDAYFNDGVEPRAAALASQPETFDPLEVALALGGREGIAVHAWINVGLVSSAVDLPTARTHVVMRRPEWLMVPRAIARELLLTDPATELYRDKLARWSRQTVGEVEGLYLSPIPAGAADHTVEVVADLASRYDVDGVHLDYVRYPTDEFDYSRESLLAFDAWIAQHEAKGTGGSRPPATLATQLLAQVEAAPDAWREFRRERMTSLVGRLRQAVRARRPRAVFSAAVVPDATDAASRRFQDWSAWLDRGIVDVVCPMAYATEVEAFTAQVAAAGRAAAGRPMWVGIGAYRLPASQTVEHIQAARKGGATGIVLFSYDGLGQAGGPAEYLGVVSRAAFRQ